MKRMCCLIVLVALVALLMGCKDNHKKDLRIAATNNESAAYVVRSLHYKKDPRTGICFAVCLSAYPSVTAVPCDKVEGQLDK